MAKDKILGIVRHVLTAGGGYVVGAGYISASSMPETVGAIMTIIGVVWSLISKKKDA